MQTNDKYEIQKTINYYFRQHAQTDLTAYGENFTQMCPSLIWKSVLGHMEFCQRSPAYDNKLDNILESLKELTGEQIWMVKSLEELPEKLLEKYPAKQKYTYGIQ
jgi:hypothetical protein